mmetsp:Transcript_86356/g.157564  ORF Transcript_86356/g.157564 Transcript_86356/m.157564 type:complete len:215 (-) Transcript_86356:324-968(-)
MLAGLRTPPTPFFLQRPALLHVRLDVLRDVRRCNCRRAVCTSGSRRLRIRPNFQGLDYLCRWLLCTLRHGNWLLGGWVGIDRNALARELWLILGRAGRKSCSELPKRVLSNNEKSVHDTCWHHCGMLRGLDVCVCLQLDTSAGEQDGSSTTWSYLCPLHDGLHVWCILGDHGEWHDEACVAADFGFHRWHSIIHGCSACCRQTGLHIFRCLHDL